MSRGVSEGLPDLQSSAHMSGRATVSAPGLLIAWEKLELLEEVCPNTERARAGTATGKIVSSISARIFSYLMLISFCDLAQTL